MPASDRDLDETPAGKPAASAAREARLAAALRENLRRRKGLKSPDGTGAKPDPAAA